MVRYRKRGMQRHPGAGILVWMTRTATARREPAGGTDPLSVTLAALANPTRRAILARLAAGEATVKEISKPFSMSGPAISKHLRVLERAGLIARGREAQWRPRRLEATPIKAVAEWAEEYRRFWDASYDRLDEYLELMKQREGKDGNDG